MESPTEWLDWVWLVVALLLIPTWLAWWNSRLTRKEFKTNGGSSMRDKVDGITSKLGVVHDRAHINSDHLEIIDRKLQDHIEDEASHVERIEEKLDEHIEYMNKVHSGKRKDDPPDYQPPRPTVQ